MAHVAAEQFSSAEDIELPEPWGLLVSVETGEKEEERLPISSERFTIGRANDVDLVLSDNKYVSSHHCTIQVDEDGVIWLKDTSTNGTLVNGEVVKKDIVKVPHKAIIKIVFHKDCPSANVVYQLYNLHDKTMPSSNTVEEVYDGDDPDATLDLTEPYIDELGRGEGEEDGERELGGGDSIERTESVVVGMKRRATESIDEITQSKKVAEEEKEEEEEEKDDNKEEEGKVEEANTGACAEDTAHTAATKPALTKKDSIEEALICQICQEILHDCVSLQPCMHSYCGGCYSEWMNYSNKCPSCRKRAQNVSKNHIVRNLVDAYLRAHPDRKRSDEDLKELDDKNKITQDMCVRVSHDSDEDGSGTSEYDDESDGDGDSDGGRNVQVLFPLRPPPTAAFGSPFGFGIAIPPPLVACRQCPGHITQPTPSSSSSSSAPSFTCPPSGNHILCQCCLQCMPDRRSETDLAIPTQKCNVCGQFYCHLYWGCRKIGCKGCLNKFKDMIFDTAVIDRIINNNAYESRILKNYLTAEGYTCQDMLQFCLVKLDSGEYHCSDSRSAQVSSNTIICYKCALKNFRDLAYQYREDIPSSRLPPEVTGRSNCYYGNNCRTQQHNDNHAERFNHICPQTKF